MHDTDPTLSAGLVARILAKLGLTKRPAVDISGLHSLFAAYCGRVPNDNVQKRIWLVGDRSEPIAGSDPTDFFEAWLAHGTGGTCFATNGALCALLQSLGFAVKRFSGSIITPDIEPDGNHGTVVATLAGIHYLVDAQLGGFKPLELTPDQRSSTSNGIHEIRAEPNGAGFDIYSFPGSNREKPVLMRLDFQYGPVDHQHFLRQYALSISRERRRSPFNDELFASRRFANSILMVGRATRTDVGADNSVTRTPIAISERNHILIDKMGMSRDVVSAIPPDSVPVVS